MKSNKEYRFTDNPKEKEFHDRFIEMFTADASAKKTLSAIVYGWNNRFQNVPDKYLTEDEENICLNIIQWLGSPVGQSFLNNCGFIPSPKLVKCSNCDDEVEMLINGVICPSCFC
jgi:hypothetical protein